MNKPTEKTDSASTAANGAVEVVTTESASKSLLPSFPCIVESDIGAVITYGSQPALRFPVGNNGELAEIDPAMLRGRGTLRLVNIKAGLKLAGKTNDADNRKWFNVTVRDVWHKVLKFAARDALANGKPVSLGLSKRTAKKTGQVTLTSKHGFEHVIVPPSTKAVEDKANKQSKTRAKRQKRNRPLVPVVAPSNVARIDALKADLSKAENQAA